MIAIVVSQSVTIILHICGYWQCMLVPSILLLVAALALRQPKELPLLCRVICSLVSPSIQRLQEPATPAAGNRPFAQKSLKRSTSPTDAHSLADNDLHQLSQENDLPTFDSIQGPSFRCASHQIKGSDFSTALAQALEEDELSES